MTLAQLSHHREPIFTLHGKTEIDLRNDLSILREWINKQPHLPSDSLADAFLEICLLKNKFSIEKCKSKIENYCTLKGVPRYEYLFRDIPVPSKEPHFFIPILNLTDDFSRIFISNLRNMDEYDMCRDLGNNLYMWEVAARFDYNDGVIFIYNIPNAAVSDIIAAIRLNVAADYLNLFMKTQSSRIKHIHVINKAANIVFGAVKSILPTKLAAKVHLHDDYETLKKFVPTSHLPKDLGGELESMNEMLAKWDKIYEENKEFLKTSIDTKAREKLRQGEFQSDEIQGTFRKLNVD